MDEFDSTNDERTLDKIGSKKGFDRMVGPKGGQISSALDSLNEKIFQESLDNIMKEKTTNCRYSSNFDDKRC